MNLNRSHAMIRVYVPLIALLIIPAASRAANPFIGDWALTIPGGGAGWLGIEEKDGKLTAQIMWGAGSVLPVESVKVDGNTLTLTRIENQRRGSGNSTVQTITATVDGDELKLTTSKKRGDFPPSEVASF